MTRDDVLDAFYLMEKQVGPSQAYEVLFSFDVRHIFDLKSEDYEPVVLALNAARLEQRQNYWENKNAHT